MGCGPSKQLKEEILMPVAPLKKASDDTPKKEEAVVRLKNGKVVAPPEPKLDKKTALKIAELKKEITTIHELMQQKMEAGHELRKERAGIEVLIIEERIKIRKLEETFYQLDAERKEMLDKTFHRDCDVIWDALNDSKTDKIAIIGVMMNRTHWELEQISEIYERKYKPLIEHLQSSLTTTLGMFTGAQTGLCNLLVFRVSPQPRRDGLFLNEYASKPDDDCLIEIFATRTNQELLKAIEWHNENYEKPLDEILTQKCSYQNYRNFMLKLLECRRDETFDTLPESVSKDLAEELYKAGAARTIGCDPTPFIRVFSTINQAQYVSINNKYPKKKLMKDLESKFGGSFEKAMVAMASDPFEHLAKRISEGDKDTITRIFGCMHRADFGKLKTAYIKGIYKKTFEEVIKNNMKGHYQLACFALLADDLNMAPTGSFREPWQDLAEIVKEGNRVLVDAEKNYRHDLVMQNGYNAVNKLYKPPVVVATATRASFTATPAEQLVGTNLNEKSIATRSHLLNIVTDPLKCLAAYDGVVDSLPGWKTSGAFFPDLAKVQALLVEYQQGLANLDNATLSLRDEIDAAKLQYFSLSKLVCETENWIRIYTVHTTSLKNYVVNRDSIIEEAFKKYARM